MNGRKRHILVDTLGLPLVVAVHAADLQDSEGAKLVLRRALGRFPRLARIWVDQGYKPYVVAWAEAVGGWALEVVVKPRDRRRFAVLPKRWIVERTFGWLGRCHRLSKDYEALPETSEAWIHLAMIHLMLKRLAPTCPLLGQALSTTVALIVVTPSTGTPTTATSCTAGYSHSAFSISIGETHSPRTLIMSSERPSYQ